MRKKLVKYIFIIADAVWLAVLFYLSIYVRHNIHSLILPKLSPLVLHNFIFVIIITLMLLYYEQVYNFRYDFWQETYKTLKALLMSFFLVLSVLTLTKINLKYSRSFIMIYFALSFITFPIFKRLIKRLIFSFGCCKEKILVVGSKKHVGKMIKELDSNWYLGQVYSKEDFDKVIVISNGFEQSKLSDTINEYINRSEVFVVPYLMDINFMNANILEYFNVHFNAIQIQNRLLIKRNILIKNIVDKFLSLMLFPLFAIIHTVVSLMIKLDDGGSIFFMQKRFGKDGKIFYVYKYRTMKENGRVILKNFLKEHPEEKEYYKKYHKYINDPRITRAGRFLRAASLDELPQILNVIKGDMSFVGPRPYMVNEGKELGDNKRFIVRVKPGITGLWQVGGRNKLSFKERNELEIWYIKNWSLWIDFVILFKTIKVVLSKAGAV